VSLCGLAALWLGAPPALRASQPEPPMLPAQLGTWKQTNWIRVEAPELERVAGPRLDLLRGGAWAAVLREYGCQRVEWASYRQDATHREGQVVVYEMQDRSGAYGAFTLLGLGGLKPGLVTDRRIALGEGGVAGVDAGLFYQGKYLVNWWMGTPIKELVEHLKHLGGQQAGLPTLPGYLPREGFIIASDRYLLGPLAMAEVTPLAEGDWAGFAYGAEAEAARYRVGNTEATLLLLSYPTPQIAAQRLRDFERLFNLNGAAAPGRPVVFAERHGTLVALVAGADAAQAARLIKAVGYDRQLSWSEPPEGSGALGWGTTVANIITSTGVLLLFALISGIAFGLVRLVVKRLLPDKVFDRPEDTEIIRLDLTRRL